MAGKAAPDPRVSLRFMRTLLRVLAWVGFVGLFLQGVWPGADSPVGRWVYWLAAVVLLVQCYWLSDITATLAILLERTDPGPPKE